MPPALSDHGSDASDDGQDFVPARAGQKAGDDIVMKEEDDEDVKDVKNDEDDEDDEEGGEDEYTVEKILKHDFDDNGNVIYLIKWLGYEKKADQTWEPTAHLESAQDLLDQYHARIGGAPVFEPEPTSTKKKGSKGRKRGASDDDTPVSNKKGRKSNGVGEDANKIDLPPGSWESFVVRVTSISEQAGPDNGKNEKRLTGNLEWHKPKAMKTTHSIRVIRQKCPQKLLDYYEQHLKFREV